MKISKMNINMKIKLVALLIALVVLTFVTLQTRKLNAQEQNQEEARPQSSFQLRSLVVASKVEIEQSAIDYTLTYTQVNGELKVLLSGVVTSQQLPEVGLWSIDAPVNFPPMYLVLLEGDIDPNGLPGLRQYPNLHAQYLLYVIDLNRGEPFIKAFSPSLEAAFFRTLIDNPPILTDGPREGENDPNKLPYGSVLRSGSF